MPFRPHRERPARRSPVSRVARRNASPADMLAALFATSNNHVKADSDRQL